MLKSIKPVTKQKLQVSGPSEELKLYSAVGLLIQSGVILVSVSADQLVCACAVMNVSDQLLEAAKPVHYQAHSYTAPRRFYCTVLIN